MRTLGRHVGRLEKEREIGEGGLEGTALPVILTRGGSDGAEGSALYPTKYPDDMEGSGASGMACT